MNTKRYFLFILFFLHPFLWSYSQGNRINNDRYYFYENIKSQDSSVHFTIKPYLPNGIQNINLESFQLHKNTFNKILLNKNLVESEGDLYSVSINPIVHSYIGISGELDFEQDYKLGVNLNVDLNDKLYFFSDLFFSKRSFFNEHSFLIDSFSVLPYYGNFINKTGSYYNFFNFTGELLYTPKSGIHFHLGKGKTFFGNGYRSLFLSDNSNSYPYFKTTVEQHRFKYVWMIILLKDFELFNGEQTYNLYNKAAFVHYLSINLTKRLNFNFFEAIITNPYDLTGRKTGYEISYFNPVIFYRPVEFYTGSSDNSLIGLGFNFRLLKSTHIYSQFILDDLLISSINDKSGWWGNKFGIQLGFKSYNLFKVPGLFLRVELNTVRPYTYAHGVTFSENEIINLNYGHYRQSLSHPLGSNFIETLMIIRYQKNRFLYTAKLLNSQIGLDFNITSFGSDIYKDYTLRPSDYGINFLQGKLSNMKILELCGSYIINPSYDLKFEAKLGYFTQNVNKMFSDQFTFQIGLSTKIFNENNEYFK